MHRPHRYPLRVFSLISLLIFTGQSLHAGMTLESPVVFLNAAEGEAFFHVDNTDLKAALLYTSLQNFMEDASTLSVTPAVALVAAGEKQLVRFTLQPGASITTQQLKHIGVERIPQLPSHGLAGKDATRQGLSVLISPGDLPEKSDPWTLLEWSVEGQQLVVRNDSRYVVMLNQQINLVAANTNLMLPNTYILPGQTYRLELPKGSDLGNQPRVRIYPANASGFAVAPYDAALLRR